MHAIDRRSFLGGLASALAVSCARRASDGAAPPPPVAPAAPPPTLALPARPTSAETGSEFFKRVARASPADFEEAMATEILRGNIPSFERRLAKVALSARVAGRVVEAFVFVTPDYLAIGDDDDFVRVPMLPRTAQRVADAAEALLPTQKIVDAIYSAAVVKLAPAAFGRGPDGADRSQITEHNALVEKARREKGGALGALTAGDKKDIVITNQLEQHKGRVAIYGWHQENGEPIQPLSVVHNNQYEDYSHGVRLVSATAIALGAPKRLEDLYRDESLSTLVSDEGPLRVVRYDAPG